MRCLHEHTTTEAGDPERSGRCQMFVVCEDCGAYWPTRPAEFTWL